MYDHQTKRQDIKTLNPLVIVPEVKQVLLSRLIADFRCLVIINLQVSVLSSDAFHSLGFLLDIKTKLLG